MNSGAAKWTNRELAYFLLRLTFGVNLMIHGLVRILSGIGGFAAGMVKQFAGTPLPPGVLLFFGHLLPWTEVAIGVLILIESYALIYAVLIAFAEYNRISIDQALRRMCA